MSILSSLLCFLFFVRFVYCSLPYPLLSLALARWGFRPQKSLVEDVWGPQASCCRPRGRTLFEDLLAPWSEWMMWRLCLLPAKQVPEESRVACAAASLAETFRVTLTPVINIGAADISGYERSGIRYDSKTCEIAKN